jgi:hypothetical protein
LSGAAVRRVAAGEAMGESTRSVASLPEQRMGAWGPLSRILALMARRDLSARNPGSAGGYVRQTRIVAGLAMLVLVAAIVSDRLANGFWTRHVLLTSLVSSLVVVGLSVAVVNEALERRQLRRWSVLAQYVLFELVRTARLTWTALMEALGLMYAGEETKATLRERR